jgi:hypothetical protein
MAVQKQTFNLKEAIEFLLDNFKVERYVYLGATLLSILLLFIIAIIFFVNKEYQSIFIMLGPTGLITFSFSRVLKMWSDCIELIRAYITN